MAAHTENERRVLEQQSRIEFHLLNWARWMKDDVFTEGYPRRAAGCLGGGYSRSFDEMVDDADVRCAMALDALIGGLEAPEAAAIHHVYLSAVFRFVRAEIETLLSKAKRKLESGLKARGCY